MNDQAILNLVVGQNSPDNNVRTAAESDFNKLAAENPSMVANELIQNCSPESTLPVDIKQSCLLHLKRMVPKFWSMGFQSFIGPPIDQELKQTIRQNLIQLAISSSNSKIRSGSSYVIVQIAAADFPDEWPDLLDILYTSASENQDETSVMGSLSVLNELFDDLITEEQFWEGGVGNKLIGYIGYILEQAHMPTSIKVSCLKLYLTVLNTLQSSEALESEDRKQSVIAHIRYISDLLLSLAKDSSKATSASDSIELVQFSLRSHVYQVFTRVLGSFRKYILPATVSSLAYVLVEDLIHASQLYQKVLVEESNTMSVLKTGDSEDAGSEICSMIINIFENLTAVQESSSIMSTLGSGEIEQFVNAVAVCAHYPKATVENYEADFNEFVTDSTGLSASVTVRDSLYEFLEDLSDEDSARLFEIVHAKMSTFGSSWAATEAALFLNEGLLSNRDSDSLASSDVLKSYFDSILGLLENIANIHPLIAARAFLLIPKILEASQSQNHVVQYTKQLEAVFAGLSTHEDNQLVMSSALISATLWKNVDEFDLTVLGPQTQISLLRICRCLLGDSEEDTSPILLEAISVAVCIDKKSVFSVVLDKSVHVSELILQVSFKDSANVQISIDASECLQVLLQDVSAEDFLQVCQKSIPFLVDVMKSSLAAPSVEYSSQLYLALDLLGNILNACPQADLPEDIFLFVFPVLKDLILSTSDDQILQNAGEVFNILMQNGERLFVSYVDAQDGKSGLEILLAIASKFLSPALSDSAAMNCGLIVTTLFERFQSSLDSQFFYQLLEATVIRVSTAKELVTIENLIMVFCKLVLSTSPSMLIDALTSIRIEDASGNAQSGLQSVLPIWFEAFEVTRGVEKIQQNILALGKIFSLGDARVASVTVDGDIIPYDGELIITRSMAKNMPQKYTQISAPHKILKLLVGELKFQCQQPDSGDYDIGENQEEEIGEDNNDDDWEDMDGLGVPNYDKLKSYVDSDDEDLDQTSDQGIREMLVQFFKECLAKDMGGFRTYYEALDDDEKTTVSENVIFS